MQIPVADPADGAVQLGEAVVLACLVGGVQPDQVVQLVPVRAALFDHVRGDQPVQRLLGLPHRQVGQRGGDLGAELVRWMQAQSPEHPGGYRVQRLVRPRERGPQVRVRVSFGTRAEGVQPLLLVGQRVSHRTDRVGALHPLGDHCQGQRQTIT